MYLSAVALLRSNKLFFVLEKALDRNNTFDMWMRVVIC